MLTPMSSRQRLIIWAWVAVVVAAGIFPPWTWRDNIGGRIYSGSGYFLLFAPPSGGQVDVTRLIIEWIIATAIIAGLYFAWPKKGRP